METETPSRRQLVYILLLFQVFGFLIYLKGLNAPFLFDDLYWIRDNGALRSLSDLNGVVTFNRPLVMLSYKLNYALTGISPAGFRLFSILLHSLCAFLLFCLARRLMAFFSNRGRPLPPLFVTAFPVLAGLLFLVSPLQSMAVMLSAYRGDVMYAVFYLLGLILFLDHLEREKPLAWCWVCLAFCGGVLCKESMITFPAVCLALDLFRGGSRRGRLARHWKLYLFLGLAAAALLVRMAGFDYGPTVGAETPAMPRGAFLLTQLTVWLHCLKVFVLPLPRWLCGDWDWPVVNSALDPAFLGSAAVLAGLAALLVHAARRGHRLPAWAMSFFFLGILPFASLVPISDPVMEYRFYLPAAGLALAAAWLTASLPRLLPEPRFSFLASTLALGFAALLVVALNLFLLADRLSVYRGSLTFWEDVAAKSPGKERAWLHLANEQVRIGRLDEAMAAAVNACRIAPHRESVWLMLGDVHRVRGDRRAALACYRQAYRIQPGSDDAANHIAGVLIEQDRLDEALAILGQFKEQAKNAEFYSNLAKILSRRGQTDPAIAVYRQVVGKAPEDFAAWTNLGNLLQKKGNFVEAEQAYLSALGSNPGYYLAHFNLGNLYFQMERMEPAEAAYRQALVHNAAFEPARLALGTLMAAGRRYFEAETHLSTYLEKEPDDLTARVRLALVLLELHRPAEARRTLAPALRALRVSLAPLGRFAGLPLSF
ncbi:MAG: tetratricopeptide repeat protein [Acidobacteria bacterium]|nr:tetratricopeptide repeat protein [Acidobacteriota bacterium]